MFKSKFDVMFKFAIYLSVWVRSNGWIMFLLGWLVWQWDGSCGCPSASGAPLHYLAPVLFQIFQCSLTLLPNIRCETEIKFFFIVVSLFMVGIIMGG